MTGTKLFAIFTSALFALTGCSTPGSRWLAGDHHIHSRYSVGWDREQNPPAPIIAGDAVYPTPVNAAMAKKFGLSWMVTTDHGGPNHSKVNRDVAYPELLESRTEVKDVIQFYGMELDTPAGDHSSLIIPHTSDEAEVLFRLESGFDKYDAFPLDPSRDTQDKMIAALEVMRAMEKPPVVIANHPSRSARRYGEYDLYDPAEFRRWNDTAPNVAVGMAGAPGHQAMGIAASITDELQRFRGAYTGFHTMGGFDQMTAKLGGFWDSMLGEGRRWWITANSDSHLNHTQGGVDFWPGEYSKTYVYAEKNYDSILSALRAGKMFVTTGDLVSELYLEVTQGNRSAAIGEEITVAPGSEITVKIRVRDPHTENAAEENPEVNHVDLITGEVTGPVEDRAANSNESTRVVQRFTSSVWKRKGEYLLMSYTLTVPGPMYVRVRGTNTDELEPELDPPAENPWSDLWFYSNPVFIKTR